MHQPTTKLHYKTLVQHHHHNNNEHTYHLIAIRYVAAYKYIQKFWRQTIAVDGSLCYVIITLFYITLTLQIMLINVTYLDISASEFPITPRHGFCVCPQPIRTSITTQHRLWLSEHTHRMIPARLPSAMYYSKALIGCGDTQNNPCLGVIGI